MRKTEILAPAGSYESMLAAVNAKADAIYIGGSKFGARAFADNLKKEDMLRAIDYTHIHDRKLYLTINTLIKNSELENELYEYLYDYYINGLDAVIVQDIGVMSFIHNNFPNLPIHASTQMTLNTGLGTEIFKDLGVTRFVTSRELSLKEIKNIRAETDLEIESFVHGALCYCYSGQCLLSSVIGGRSGNRGRCAQPCRMPYNIRTENSFIKNKYVLSPKDICTLEIIPELVKAGINSFKIEGRMKKPEYTAYTAYVYGYYIDLYEKLGEEEYRKYIINNKIEFNEHFRNLMDLYNRGGFSEGYYMNHNDKSMISMERPNHNGVKIGNVIKVLKNEAEIKLIEDINAQDVVEIRDNQERIYEFTIKSEVLKEQTIRTKFLAGADVKKGQPVYRTKNTMLLENIKENIIEKKERLKITGEFIAEEGKPIKLTIKYRENYVCVTGDICELAQKQPVTEEKIRKQINKTNETDFIFEDLSIKLIGNLFIPLVKINELRREAIKSLENKIISEYKRILEKPIKNNVQVSYKAVKDKFSNTPSPRISVMVKEEKMLETVLNIKEIDNIYIDMMNLFIDEAVDLCRKAVKENKNVYLALPHIIKKEHLDYLYKNREILIDDDISGFIVRNYEGAEFISRILKESSVYKDIILDYNMYIMNKESINFWKNKKVNHFTMPLELNYRELNDLECRRADILVYGYIPLMISAQCIYKNTQECVKIQKQITITDRVNKDFYVLNNCKYCYNTIYNGQALSLLENAHEVFELSPVNIRIDLSYESLEEANIIVKSFVDVYKYKKDIPCDYIRNIKKGHYTKGHFKRGIE